MERYMYGLQRYNIVKNDNVITKSAFFNRRFQ